MKRREICNVLLLGIFPMLVRFEITLPETRNSLQTQRYNRDDDVEEKNVATYLLSGSNINVDKRRIG
jgi:hypothetical protein